MSVTGKRIVVSAPGKIILHGEHSVVYGKEALACAIDLKTYCSIEVKKFDGQTALQIKADNLDLNLELDKSSTQALLDGAQLSEELNTSTPELLDVIKSCSLFPEEKLQQMAFVLFLSLYLGIGRHNCLDRSTIISLHSDLPIGAGLGSSASYSTCLAAGLLLAFGKITLPSTGYSLSKENRILINHYVYETEKIVHGSPSGIDNNICVHGGALSFKNGQMDLDMRLPTLTILVINSNITRSTKDLVAGVRERYVKHPEIFTGIFNTIEQTVLSAKDCYQRMLLAAQDSDSGMERELYCNLEDYIKLNQGLLRCMGVSHPILEKICELCERHGLSTKLTGAGGGGCSFTIVPPDYQESKLTQLRLALKEQGFPSWISRIGCDGVKIESIENLT